MDDQTIDNLREALKHSPDNRPLRLHLAESLLERNRLDEAEVEYQVLLGNGTDAAASFGISRVFFARKEYSKCNVVLEQLIEVDDTNTEVLLLHVKALIAEHDIKRATDTYKQVLNLLPGFSDPDIDAHLRLGAAEFAEDDEEHDHRFVERPNINFDDVGGMENVKTEIDLKIIQALKNPELYKAYGKKVGGGILLYGPPGCGKTYLAKATAGQVNAKFISVGLNDILDMWIGNSEKNLHEVFELARENAPCVLFFDEIDAIGASRTDMKTSASRHVINQLLQELDGMENNNDGVLILGATNTPWHLDAAFRRPGRFDRIIFVPPPDKAAREAIFKLKLKEKPTEVIDYDKLASKTTDHSGADIEAVIDIAVESKLEEALKIGAPQPLKTKDFLGALKKHRPSTKEWFKSAKNFALYANESGLYDEILQYLKIKK